MGWFTVAAYAAVALLALRVWLQRKESIWLAVALGMAALCVNKQFDLQSLFTDIGRVIASHQGWYDRRREAQKIVVLAVIGIAGLTGIAVVWRYQAFWWRHRLLAAGLMLLLTFIAVRAISFHHVDSFLQTRHLGLKMNWALELGGIFLTGWAAARKMG